MKIIKHQKIRLIAEDMESRDTTVECNSPLPKFIVDDNGCVYLKNKMLFGSSWARVVYSQIPATLLSAIEVLDLIDDYAGEAILDRFIDPEELNTDR